MTNSATPAARRDSGSENSPRRTTRSRRLAQNVVLASPKGGQPPLDPKSNEPENQTDLTRKFEADAAANAQLAATLRLDSVSQASFDTVFYPGGHGPMWDLAEDQSSIRLIESVLAAGKPVALVCHAPGVLCHAQTPDGKPLVEGKKVTGFTNTEEEGVGLTEIVPFLVEDELKAKRRPLFQGSGPRASCRERRPPDHGTEPALFWTYCEGADRAPLQREVIAHSPSRLRGPPRACSTFSNPCIIPATDHITQRR